MKLRIGTWNVGRRGAVLERSSANVGQNDEAGPEARFASDLV
jgi:hypothetical protein